MKFNLKRTRTTETRLAVLEAVEDRTLFSAYLVTTNSDSGDGSLRAAINAANAHAGADVIDFAIATRSKTITPLTQLPQLSGRVTIDGATQRGYTNKPLVEIDGSLSHGYGLVTQSGGNLIRGLSITHFSSGLLLLGAGHNAIVGCYIGVNLSGAAAGNTDKGIIVQSPYNVIGGHGRINRNVISGNTGIGIQLYTSAATGNRISDNFIGTNATGTAAIANGTGIALTGAANNTIGGKVASERNIISGNTTDGVVVNSTGSQGNLIAGNYIGTNVLGTAKLANQSYGVEISQPSNVVGGVKLGQRNIISGNGNSGVVLWLASANHCKIMGNYIGTDVTGRRAIGNAVNGLDVSSGASENVIGGTARGAGNVISGNAKDGVNQYQGTRNAMAGNTIGFNANHTAALPNGNNGLTFTFASANIISSNYIGNNGGTGVTTFGGTNKLVGNTILNDNTWGFN